MKISGGKEMKRMLVLSLVLALLLAGVSTAMAEKVTISFWYAIGGNAGRVFQEMVEEFNAASDSVFVDAVYTGNYGETAQKVTASLAANTLPDGGLIPAAPLFTGRVGNYLIDEYLRGPKGLDMDDFYDEFWNYNRYDGRIASLPFNNSTPVLFYNKDILTQAGLEPKAPETWDEMVEMATQLKEWAAAQRVRNFTPINMRSQDWMLKAFILQNGGELMNEDYTASLINEPAAVEAIEFWVSLIDQGLMPAGVHDRARDQFIAGNQAFLFDSTAGIGTIAGTVEFDMATAMLPGNKQRAVTLGGAALTMFPSTQEKQDATWEFLSWLLTPENVASWSAKTGYVPVRKSVLESDEIQTLFAEQPYYKAAFEQLEYVVSIEHFWELGALDDYLGQLINNVEYKSLTPQEAADKLVKDLADDIARNE
jgi:sn-glycerol 3-phosphate transport system substrate-binding protein